MFLFVSMWYSCRILFLTFITICYVYYVIILVYFINKPARVLVPMSLVIKPSTTEERLYTKYFPIDIVVCNSNLGKGNFLIIFPETSTT